MSEEPPAAEQVTRPLLSNGNPPERVGVHHPGQRCLRESQIVRRSDLNRVLDVIGTGMLIPMPPLWLCDAALIAADRFRLPELAFVNPAVQGWETALFGIGLHTALGIPRRHAMQAGLAASVVYVLAASRFLR